MKFLTTAWAIFLVFLWLISPNLVIFGEKMWALQHIEELASNVRLLLVMIGLFVCIPSTNLKIRQSLKIIFLYIEKVINKKPGKYSRITVCLLFTFIFTILRSNNLQLGDAWYEHVEYADSSPTWRYFMSSPLSSYILYITHIFLNNLSFFSSNGKNTVAFVSIIFGTFFIYYLFLLCDLIGKTRLEKTFIFGLVTSSCFMQIFFGYTEIMAIPVTFTIIFIYYSIKYLNGEATIYVPTIILCIGFWTHLDLGLFIPSLIYIYAVKQEISFDRHLFKNLITFESFKIIGLFTFLSMLLLLFIEIDIYYEFNVHITDLGHDVDKAALFPPLSVVLSIKHIGVILNQQLMFSSISVIIIFCYLYKSNFSILSDNYAGFLFFMFVFYFIYTLVSESGPRRWDWDLYTPLTVPLTLLASRFLILVKLKKEEMEYISLVIISINFLFSIPWIIGNNQM